MALINKSNIKNIKRCYCKKFDGNLENLKNGDFFIRDTGSRFGIIVTYTIKKINFFQTSDFSKNDFPLMITTRHDAGYISYLKAPSYHRKPEYKISKIWRNAFTEKEMTDMLDADAKKVSELLNKKYEELKGYDEYYRIYK